MPETTYHRRNEATTERSSVENIDKDSEKQSIEQREQGFSNYRPQKKSYFEELKIYNGVYPTKASIGALLARPFIACLTPVCLWAGLVYGVAITWLVLIATSVSQLFSAEPYNFTTAQVGLTYSRYLLCPWE